MNEAIPSAPWKLTYSDGAANVYRWSQDKDGAPVHFVYEPITPETSSTGTYSGGDPRDEELSASDPRLAELWEKARALQADSAQHAPARNKGTGAFTLVTSKGGEQFIIDQGAGLESLAPLLDSFRSP